MREKKGSSWELEIVKNNVILMKKFAFFGKIFVFQKKKEEYQMFKISNIEATEDGSFFFLLSLSSCLHHKIQIEFIQNIFINMFFCLVNFLYLFLLVILSRSFMLFEFMSMSLLSEHFLSVRLSMFCRCWIHSLFLLSTISHHVLDSHMLSFHENFIMMSFDEFSTEWYLLKAFVMMQFLVC